MVYVISKEGKPLMPTNRHGKVRILLKEKKARIVQRKPFTIQLLYDSTTYTQNITAGFDTGRNHLSITAVNSKTGKVLYSSVLDTRNKEIPKLMKKRQMYRMIRRRNRRMKKIRRAIKYNTYFKISKKIVKPGTKEPITVKYIKPKESRFSNRVRPDGWLTPTARHLLQTHINYFKNVEKILPIKKLVLEYGKFDTQKLENPDIKGKEYQHGILYNYNNLREYITTIQHGKCLLCGKNPIEHLHHVLPQSDDGSDTYKNVVGLCNECHKKVHINQKAKEKLAEKVTGTTKEYADASILNIIMPHLYNDFKMMLGTENIEICYGYETETKRKSLNLNKSHWNDSYTMSLMKLDTINNIETIIPYHCKQYRRHSRAFCNAQRDRLYKKDGKIVARNRHSRPEQESISLSEYRSELIDKVGKAIATKVISNLKVYAAIKQNSTPTKKVLLRPGYASLYKGQRVVVRGFLNKGSSLILEDISGYIPIRKCHLIVRNVGIVYL